MTQEQMSANPGRSAPMLRSKFQLNLERRRIKRTRMKYQNRTTQLGTMQQHGQNRPPLHHSHTLVHPKLWARMMPRWNSFNPCFLPSTKSLFRTF